MDGYDEERRQRRSEDLVSYPREDLDTEIKPWLDLRSEEDKANLAQALLALANHGGGWVLLGFADHGGSWAPAANRPADLGGYDQDIVNGIVQRYADPAFHCAVYFARHSQTREEFPVIHVPGQHYVPIRAKRDGPGGRHVRQHTYYIRRPGPASEPPQSAQEWDGLIRRCVRAGREQLLAAMRSVLTGIAAIPASEMPEAAAADRLGRWSDAARERFQSLVAAPLPAEQPSRYAYGVWTIAYSLTGSLRPTSLSELLQVLKGAKGSESGWPPWWIPTREAIEPYPYDDGIECWLRDTRFGDAAHSDFWRASPDGMMFLLRGYDEDSSPQRLQPGAVLEGPLRVWRLGECLLHAERLAQALAEAPVTVLFHATWEGLAGRVLVTPFQGGICRQATVSSAVTVTSDQISGTLPEIVGRLLTPLADAFAFSTLEPAMIQAELTRMRGRSG